MYKAKTDISRQSDKTDLASLMKVEHIYPDQDDENFQSKIYSKREFYINKMQERDELQKPSEIRKFRDEICAPSKFTLQPHQSFLSNFINPDTPYKGLLIFHGTGTGKCNRGDQLLYIDNTKKRMDVVWNKYNTGVFKIDICGGEWSKPKKKLYINTYDNENKSMIKKEIKHLYREKVNTVLKHVILANGKEIIVTLPHKLLTDKGWINNIKVGMKIGTYDFKQVVYSDVINIHYINHTGYVYDIEVETYHNYVVSGIISHNTCAAIAIAEKI